MYPISYIDLFSQLSLQEPGADAEIIMDEDAARQGVSEIIHSNLTEGRFKFFHALSDSDKKSVLEEIGRTFIHIKEGGSWKDAQEKSRDISVAIILNRLVQKMLEAEKEDISRTTFLNILFTDMDTEAIGNEIVKKDPSIVLPLIRCKLPHSRLTAPDIINRLKDGSPEDYEVRMP